MANDEQVRILKDGVRTLELSGPLPTAFLRGCGLPNRLIESLSSLLDRTMRFHSCFISYSTHDREFANQLHQDLQDKGVRCWFASEDRAGASPARSGD